MALTFDYKVRDRTGKLVEGQLEGDSMALVVGRLREMGYLPISVTPKGKVNLNTEIHIPGSDRPGEARRDRRRDTPARDDDRLRTLGGPLPSPCSPVRSRTRSSHGSLHEVRLDVERGSSLSAAVAKHPKVFSQLFVTMVQAGEAGGSLDKVLLDLATTMEKQAALMRSIRGAMTYPAVVLRHVVIFLALLIFIVPIFKNLFASLHASLPTPTLIIIHISNIILSWRAIIVVIVIIGGIVAFKQWIGTENGRAKWDRFKLRPPIFGQLMHKTAIARFTGTLASLVSSGVPILESLTSSLRPRETSPWDPCCRMPSKVCEKGGRSPTC